LTIQQNFYNEWDETLEKNILKRFKLHNHYLNVIAFRTMLEDGINSFETLLEQIAFINLFPIYLFNTDNPKKAIENPQEYWKSSYEYDYCIPLYEKNFYKIGGLLYYIDY
jgi:hypothetical protein